MIDLLNIAAHFIGSGRLLLGGGGDLRQAVGHQLHGLNNGVEVFTHGQHAAYIAFGLTHGVFHLRHRLAHHTVQVGHGFGDFGRGVLRALGE